MTNSEMFDINSTFIRAKDITNIEPSTIMTLTVRHVWEGSNPVTHPNDSLTIIHLT